MGGGGEKNDSGKAANRSFRPLSQRIKRSSRKGLPIKGTWKRGVGFPKPPPKLELLVAENRKKRNKEQ